MVNPTIKLGEKWKFHATNWKAQHGFMTCPILSFFKGGGNYYYFLFLIQFEHDVIFLNSCCFIFKWGL